MNKVRYWLGGLAVIAIITLLTTHNGKSGNPIPSPETLTATGPKQMPAQTSAGITYIKQDSSSQAPSQTAETRQDSTKRGRYHTEIKRLASRHKITLSEYEATQLQESYSSTYEARQAIESKNAKVSVIDSNHYSIEIPPYESEGKTLRAKFESDLIKTLGSYRAQQFLATVSIAISDANNNWGAEAQVIDVSYNNEAGVYIIIDGKGLEYSPASGAPVLVSRSQLKPSNLGKYTYLKSLFPTSIN